MSTDVLPGRWEEAISRIDVYSFDSRLGAFHPSFSARALTAALMVALMTLPFALRSSGSRRIQTYWPGEEAVSRVGIREHGTHDSPRVQRTGISTAQQGRRLLSQSIHALDPIPPLTLGSVLLAAATTASVVGIAAPSRSTHTTATLSPSVGSANATAAQSRTSGWLKTPFSTCPVEMFSPPRTITSLAGGKT